MNRLAALLFAAGLALLAAACATTEKERARDRSNLQVVDPTNPQHGQLPDAIRM